MFWTKNKGKRFHWTEDHKPKQKQWTADEFAKEYHTTRWRRLRALHIGENPYCEMCKFVNKLTVAQVVDHIKPVSQGGEMYDRDNLQSLCHSCHNSKSAKERHEHR